MKLFRTQAHRMATLLFAALYASIFSPLLAKTDQRENTPLTTYARLAEYHLPSLAQKAMVEERANEERKKQNAENIQKKHNAIKPPTLGNVEKLRLTYHLLGLLDQPTRDRGDLIAHETINDLELLCGPKDATENHLFAAIDNTITTIGKVELQKILLSSQINVKTLKDRQKIVKTLVEDEQLFAIVQKSLEQFKTHEDDLISFWRTAEEEVELLFSQLYYGKFMYFFDLSYLNKNTQAMQYKHTMQIAGAPTVAALWPFWIIFGGTLIDALESEARGHAPDLINRFFRNSGMCLTALKELTWGLLTKGGLNAPLAGAFMATSVFAIYFLPLILTIRNSARINDLSSLIHKKMNNLASLTNTMSLMGTLVEKHPTLCSIFPEHTHLKTIQGLHTAEAQELVELLKTDTFKGEPSVLSLKGRVFAAYKMMESSKDTLITSLKAMGKMDAYMSIAKLYKKHASNNNATYCFVDYKTGSLHPSLAIENYWHPILDPKTVVTNSIDADLTTGAGNVIITGPNAGGKSTALKAVALSILLGQTFGIAPAKRMVFTPFSDFKTHLNIADTEGKESLFQAEMRRAQELITDIKRLKANEFSFTILDEIFTGTNPEEGQAGAYGVAKHLAQLGNSMCFVATHYKKLTELDTATGGRYKNYKVSVIIHDNGAITPTYKLEPGISDQKIALQLLQNAGFGSEILDAAHEVMGSQKRVVAY